MKKSLSATNPYLRNHALKKKMVKHLVESFSAIEGIRLDHKIKFTGNKKNSKEMNHQLQYPENLALSSASNKKEV